MTRQPLTTCHMLAWLHGDVPIVYYTLRTVDGARLPYTRAMLERHEARVNYVPELPIYTVQRAA
jgi:hypothetical protein